MAVVFMLTVITGMRNLTITVCSKNIVMFTSLSLATFVLGILWVRIKSSKRLTWGGTLQGMIQPG